MDKEVKVAQVSSKKRIGSMGDKTRFTLVTRVSTEEVYVQIGSPFKILS